MLELTVDRGVARSIMNEVVRQCCGGGGGNDDEDEIIMKKKEKSASKYHIVRMMVSLGDDNRRRMELVADADVDRKAAEKNWEGGSIFSISLALPGDEHNVVEDDGDDEDVDENGNPIHDKKHGNSVPPSNRHHRPLLEQLVAAHEMALATQREKASSTDGNAGELLDIFCDMSILPAPELCGEESDDQGMRTVRRVKRGRDRMHLSSTATTGSTTTSRKNNNDNSKFGSTSSASKASAAMPLSSSSVLPSNKGKPTTAAAFFGSQQATSATKKKDSSSSKSSTNTMPERNTTNIDDESITTTFVNESPTQKENKANKSLKVKNGISSSAASIPPPASTKHKGNADDFLGDVDEDDDFLEAEMARKARVAKEAQADDDDEDKGVKRSRAAIGGGVGGGGKKKAVAAPTKDNGETERQEGKNNDYDDDDNDDEMVVEYDDVIKVKKVKKNAQAGSMDAFAKKKDNGGDTGANANVTAGTSKKRRKKMVEQTTIDKNGYMCTETVTVWEDVEDEEEIKESGKPKAMATASTGSARNNGKCPSSSSASSSKNNTTKSGSAGGSKGGPKKQAGLMGFFAKKK